MIFHRDFHTKRMSQRQLHNSPIFLVDFDSHIFAEFAPHKDRNFLHDIDVDIDVFRSSRDSHRYFHILGPSHIFHVVLFFHTDKSCKGNFKVLRMMLKLAFLAILVSILRRVDELSFGNSAVNRNRIYELITVFENDSKKSHFTKLRA